MPMTPEQAKQWAFKNSKFLSLNDGDSFTAKLKDTKPIPSRFDAEKEVIRYTFEMEDGTVKYWENGSGKTLEQMSEYVGMIVQVIRNGEGNQTKYEVLLAE
mgnify:CR=1 FL=1